MNKEFKIWQQNQFNLPTQRFNQYIEENKENDINQRNIIQNQPIGNILSSRMYQVQKQNCLIINNESQQIFYHLQLDKNIIDDQYEEIKMKLKQYLNQKQLQNIIFVDIINKQIDNCQKKVIQLQCHQNNRERLLNFKQDLKQYYEKYIFQDYNLFIDQNNYNKEQQILIFEFLNKHNNQISDILNQNQIQSIPQFSFQKLQITAKLNKQQFQSIKVQLTKLIQSLQTIQSLLVNSKLNIFDVNKKYNISLKKYFEKEFDIMILPEIIFLNQDYNLSYPQFNTQILNLQQQNQYIVNIVGKNFQYVQQTLFLDILQLQKCELLALNEGEFIQHDQIKNIEQNNKVAIYMKDQNLFIVGLEKNINNAILNIQENKNIQKQNEEEEKQNSQMQVQIYNYSNELLAYYIKVNRNILDQIQYDHKVEIIFDHINLKIQGEKHNIEQAQTEVLQLFQVIEKELITKIIDQKYYIIFEQVSMKYIQKNFEVFIKIIKQQQQQISDVENQNIQEIDHQWYYQVYKGDANYNQRADKINDIMKFDAEQNSQIEIFYQQCCENNSFQFNQLKITGQMNKIKNYFEYIIQGENENVDTWYQLNTTTNRKRPLKRISLIENQMQHSINKFLDKLLSKNINEHQSQNLQFSYEVCGNYYNIQKLNNYLDDYLKTKAKFYITLNEKYKNIINSRKFIVEELNNYAQEKYNCQVSTNQKGLYIIGENYKQAENYIYDVIEKLCNCKFPISWTNLLCTLMDEQRTIVILNDQSQEYQNIKQEFQKSMYNSQIIQIERIQNRKIWKIYEAEKENIREKYNQDSKELYLFHGTKNTQPNEIYESEEGFDLRFSFGGMWGIAVYFAVNASYSDGYAHINQGKKQMFYAKVQVGQSQTLSSDRTLKMPPLMQGKKQRYDSVNGQTDGSVVYMIYTNKKAYPEYLITYQ